MTPEIRKQLADLIENRNSAIIGEWIVRTSALLSARKLTRDQLIDSMPKFLDELAKRIRDIDRQHHWGEGIHTEEEIENTAKEHGRQRFSMQYDVLDVIKEYGILLEVTSDFAETEKVLIGGKGGHVFHYTFNQALSAASDAFQKLKAEEEREQRKKYLNFILHDLKTPLNAMMVASQVLQDKVDDPRLVAEMNGIISRNGKRLDQLLQRTISVSKISELEDLENFVPREFELWPLIQSVIDEFRVHTNLSHTSINNVVPSSLVIYADSLAIQSAFRNLISNALKYAPGGKIVIGVTTHKEDLDLWIRDDGVGIPKSKIPQLFHQVSPDPKQEGSTGLGLLMVKKIVEAHNGQVCVESQEGQGATFRLTLPQPVVQ